MPDLDPQKMIDDIVAYSEIMAASLLSQHDAKSWEELPSELKGAFDLGVQCAMTGTWVVLQRMAVIPGRDSEFAQALPKVFYVLRCEDCDMEVPFETAQARADWWVEHTTGTGHARITVKDVAR